MQDMTGNTGIKQYRAALDLYCKSHTQLKQKLKMHVTWQVCY